MESSIRVLIVYWVEVIVAFIVNSCMLYLCLRTPNFRKAASNIFLINLIVSNLLTALAASIALGTHFGKGKPNHSDAATLFMYIYTALLVAHLLSVLLVTADRFIAVVYPFYYQKLLRKRNVRIMLITTWVFSLLSISTGTVLASTDDTRIINVASDSVKYIIIIIGLIGMLFLIVSNAVILRVVRKQIRLIISISVFGDDEAASKQHTNNLRKKELRATYLCFAIAGLFVITWCPLVAGCIITVAHEETQVAKHLMDAGKYLILFGITLDSCLYVPFKSELRKLMKNLSCFRKWRNKTAENKPTSCKTTSSSTAQDDTSM